MNSSVASMQELSFTRTSKWSTTCLKGYIYYQNTGNTKLVGNKFLSKCNLGKVLTVLVRMLHIWRLLFQVPHRGKLLFVHSQRPALLHRRTQSQHWLWNNHYLFDICLLRHPDMWIHKSKIHSSPTWIEASFNYDLDNTSESYQVE